MVIRCDNRGFSVCFYVSVLLKLNEMKSIFNTKSILVVLVLLFTPMLADAQCAMCRAVLESESSQNAAQGINDGILYLMIFPYLLVGGLGYYIYRSYRKKKYEV